MNYFGYDISPDLTITKDGKRMFEAIPCYSIADCELIIDSKIMADSVVDDMSHLPSLSNIEIKSILNEVQ